MSLVSALAGDLGSAALSSFFVAPFVVLIDRAVIQGVRYHGVAVLFESALTPRNLKQVIFRRPVMRWLVSGALNWPDVVITTFVLT